MSYYPKINGFYNKNNIRGSTDHCWALISQSVIRLGIGTQNKNCVINQPSTKETSLNEKVPLFWINQQSLLLVA